jgi:hypothetical protein
MSYNFTPMNDTYQITEEAEKKAGDSSTEILF